MASAARDTEFVPEEPELGAFLRAYLGAWPGNGELTIVGSPARTHPGWDGAIRPAVGVRTPTGGVLSVAPEAVQAAREAIAGWDDMTSLPALVGRPGAQAYSVVFRWTRKPAELPDAGVWTPTSDPRVPEWLRPFNGDLLVAFDDGVYAAGVGLKWHDPTGFEISVGTDERYRGRGLARRLVAQAARWILARGAVPLYLHETGNVASARTAVAAGFPDPGWRMVGVGEA